MKQIKIFLEEGEILRQREAGEKKEENREKNGEE